MTVPAPRTCASCGREITWRKKWADDWHNVRYCSTACRRRGVTPTDRRLEQIVLDAAAAEPRGVLLSRALARAERELGDALPLESLKRAARRLAADGRVVLRQNGHAVDPSTARGDVEVRRA